MPDPLVPPRAYLTGLLLRRNPAVSLVMTRKPTLSTAELIGSDQKDYPPVRLSIPVRQMQESKNALAKTEQAIASAGPCSSA